MLFGSSPIPKQYRAPRPTTLPGRSQHLLSRLPRAELLAVVCAAGLVAVWPLPGLDAWITRQMLELHVREDPLQSAFVLRIRADPQSMEDCGARLTDVMERVGVRRVVLISAAAHLCALRGTTGARVAELSDTRALLLDSMDRPIGWRLTPDDTTSTLSQLGLNTSRWLVPHPLSSVPTVKLDELVTGSIPPASVAGRVAVVEVGTRTSPIASRVAAAIGSGLEGGQRHPMPRPWASLLAAALSLGLALAQRRGPLMLVMVFGIGAVTLTAAAWGMLAWPWGMAIPLGRLLAVSALSAGLLQLPRALANRRALEHAADLIERAALMRSDGLHTIPDAEFWPRVGDLAIQAHPADSLLVAELPPREWHLKFWPYRGMGDNVIKERRRDIRRTPYSNEEGTPVINVTRRFLVMDGTPAVVVPLIALGEIEGYIFLCGDTAERAHMASPEVAQRLSQDLGLMLRRRRIGQADERKWRSTDTHAARGPGMHTAQLVEGAELALGDLRIFNALLRGAPVGLLYADSFGHVRVLGSAFSSWLSDRGVAVPPGAVSAPLSPGALMLGSILRVLRTEDGPSVSLAQIGERPEGVSFEIPVPANEHRPARMTVFRLRALEESADGVSWTAGFVGTLTEHDITEVRGQQDAVRLPIDSGLDSLSVQPLAGEVRNAVRAAAAAAGRPVRLEPPRDLGHAIAYHRELADALTDLLYDAALRNASGDGPVVTVEEQNEVVSIHIMDILFGLPTSALKRALLAPTDPPEGLAAFGRFVRAVSASHGRVELKEDDWGVCVTAHLLRARPLVRQPSLRPSTPDQSDADKASSG